MLTGCVFDSFPGSRAMIKYAVSFSGSNVMKTLIDFIKTTLLGGLLVLLPLLIFLLLFNEVLDLIIALVPPFMAFLPGDFLESDEDPLFMAVILLVGFSFLFGLGIRSITLKSTAVRFESSILSRLPMYKSVKKLSRGLMGIKEAGVFTCGIMEINKGILELVVVWIW